MCEAAYSTPVDVVFDFRFNEFLAKCIREHDTQSLIWALGRMRDDARPSSFIFAPQTELSRAYPEESGAVPDRELVTLRN